MSATAPTCDAHSLGSIAGLGEHSSPSTRIPITETTCERAKRVEVDPATGEVVWQSECDRNSCPTCAPRKCERLSRHIAWALSDVQFCWSITLSPADEFRVPQALAALRRKARAGGKTFEYAYVVEQASRRHVHLLAWTDYDLSKTVRNSQALVVNRIAPTFADRRRVAEYLVKAVTREGRLAQHLALNEGRLIPVSRHFWAGFLDYDHVRREYWRQHRAASAASPSPAPTSLPVALISPTHSSG